MGNFAVKKCKECGREFIPKNGTQQYCSGPHVTICEGCGKAFEYTCSPKEKPHTCSRACQTIMRKKHLLEKYGVDNVSKLDSVKAKISEANSSAEVSNKRKETCLQKYGVDNVSKAPEIKAKLSEVMSSEEYLTKRAKTNIERYGGVSCMSSEEVKRKRDATNLERYGMKRAPMQLSELAKKMIDGTKAQNYVDFKADPIKYIQSRYTYKPGINQLHYDLGVTDTPIYDILVAHQCSDLIDHSHSEIENEIVSFLIDCKPSIEVIRNDRTQIKPLELDVYLPEYRIAFECNPTVTHNSSVGSHWGDDPKPYTYHKNKSASCTELGVFLFHIFGYEWYAKKDMLKSMIQNLLGLTPNKIGARETTVVELTSSECKEFLNSNHRQGNTVASIRLGLKDNNGAILSVMTFNHPRYTLGKLNTDNNDVWELSRFCNKLDYNVVGGASKLLSYFIKHYSPSKIISFSDIAHTRGNLYQTLGFHEVSESAPSYVWARLDDMKYFTRVSCQKRFLKKTLNDDSIDIINYSEKEIMMSHGYAQVFDCGVKRWEKDFR